MLKEIEFMIFFLKRKKIQVLIVSLHNSIKMYEELTSIIHKPLKIRAGKQQFWASGALVANLKTVLPEERGKEYQSSTSLLNKDKILRYQAKAAWDQWNHTQLF